MKIQARKDRTGYSTPEVTIDLNKADQTGKKYASLFQIIYGEFGEKAFTAVGFDTKGKAFNPILVVNDMPLSAEYCPPCYDFIAYGWANSLHTNEIFEIKFYEAGSKYSMWLTPNPPPPTVSAQIFGGAPKVKKDVTGKFQLYMTMPDAKIYLPVVSVKTYANSYRGNPKGAIVFSYEGIYQAREFYQPDYENNSSKIPDDRTTIYWNPEVKTDSTGTAKVSFFNSDLKGKAQIKIAGVSFSLKDASTATGQYLSH